MARRYSGNMNGEQYLGNPDKREAYDLAPKGTAGYDSCAKCLGSSTR